MTNKKDIILEFLCALSILAMLFILPAIGAAVR